MHSQLTAVESVTFHLCQLLAQQGSPPVFCIARLLQHISKRDASADMLFLPSSSSVTLLLHATHLISAAVLAVAGIACWSLITAC